MAVVAKAMVNVLTGAVRARPLCTCLKDTRQQPLAPMKTLKYVIMKPEGMQVLHERGSSFLIHCCSHHPKIFDYGLLFQCHVTVLAIPAPAQHPLPLTVSHGDG